MWWPDHGARPSLGLLLGLVVFGFMAVEARRAARNEQIQRARGGTEPPGDVYAVMRVAYPAAFLAMIGELFLRSLPTAPTVTSFTWLTGGLVVFAAAKALKWWAIVSLGACWTFRVIVVPGSTRVDSGPYRYLRHPNYVAVVAELIGVALMTGARAAGPIAVVGFAALIVRRVAVENRALDAILRR